MQWIQNYIPLGSLGLSALVAAIPLFILLYMLGIRRSKGQHAAFFATLAAVILAIAVWGMPVSLAVMATLNGMFFGLFPVVWIIITAIWVYNMSVESGEFEIIKNSLACITDDRRLQALFIAFAFGAFLEGTAGFGTPVAITAAMLVGLGFQPVYAAGVCLIANTAPVAFGAIGIPIVVAAGVTGLDLMHISAIVGRQLPFLSIIVPLWLVVTMSGWKSAMEVLPAIIVTGVCFAVSQFVVSNFVGPYLPDIIAAVVTIIGLGVFLIFWKPPTIWRFDGVAPTAKVTCLFSRVEVVRAWVPYIILAIMVFLWGLDFVKAILGPIGTTFQWPLLHNLVMKTAPIVAKNTPYPAVFDAQYRHRRRHRHLYRRAAVRAGHPQLRLRPGLCLPGPDHPNPEVGHRHRFHDPRPGLDHELLRHEFHPGPGLHRHRRLCSRSSLPFWVGWACSSPAPTPPPTPCSAPCRRPRRSKSGWTPLSWWRPTPAAAWSAR